MEASSPAFVSLGMVILDDLHFPHAPAMYKVLGGSGAWATLGARLIAGKERSNEVGCLVMAGNDFPDAVQERLESWGVSLVVHRDSDRPTSRGLLEYLDEDFGRKTFRYLTTPLQPQPSDLAACSLLIAMSIHVLLKPAVLQAQIPEILRLRKEQGIDRRPLIVWEPFPPECNPTQRTVNLEACRLVDVFSPNHLELVGLFKENASEEDADAETIEKYADIFLESGIGPDGNGAVIVRAGGRGCLVALKTAQGANHAWLPPFYDTADGVVDATGAGNTFLGALAFAIVACGKDAVEAAEMASVATSFALQQIGLPGLETGEDGVETWNGDQMARRERNITAKHYGHIIVIVFGSIFYAGVGASKTIQSHYDMIEKVPQSWKDDGCGSVLLLCFEIFIFLFWLPLMLLVLIAVLVVGIVVLPFAALYECGLFRMPKTYCGIRVKRQPEARVDDVELGDRIQQWQAEDESARTLTTIDTSLPKPYQSSRVAIELER